MTAHTGNRSRFITTPEYDWEADAYGSYHAWINHKRAEYERHRIWLGDRWETAAEMESRLANGRGAPPVKII